MKRILQDIMKKRNTWHIQCLVNESFVQASQPTSVLYWRLTDFWSGPLLAIIVIWSQKRSLKWDAFSMVGPVGTYKDSVDLPWNNFDTYLKPRPAKFVLAFQSTGFLDHWIFYVQPFTIQSLAKLPCDCLKVEKGSVLERQKNPNGFSVGSINIFPT